MPWGKLDDSLYDHPKLDALGTNRMACLGLWTAVISWSNRRLTDGYVPTERVLLLGGTVVQADTLVRAGLFERATNGYQVHDFLDFNGSRESILKRRAEDALRQKSWRDSHRDSGRTNGVSPSTPTRPVPVPNPNQGDRIFERMTERRMERFRLDGFWDDGWGPRPA